MRFSNVKFQLFRFASLLMLAGLIFMMINTERYPVGAGASVVFIILVAVYVAVMCSFIWLWLARLQPKQKLLSALRRECKIATADGKTSHIANSTGAGFNVYRRSKGEYAIEMLADSNFGITWILGKHSLEGCDMYAHKLSVSPRVVIAIVKMLKGYNANSVNPAFILNEMARFYEERTRVGVDLHDELEAIKAEEALMKD